jgi:hypothetical protein
MSDVPFGAEILGATTNLYTAEQTVRGLTK